MNYNEFLKTKEFIISDIKREIRLAQATNDPERKKYLEKAKVNPGGGNFLAVLGLLCYTEFLGKLKYNIKNGKGEDIASENFNRFFDDLGSRYKRFRAKRVKVYDIFRCGMAHEYHVKKSCKICICLKSGSRKNGIGFDKNDNKYYFVVEKYFADFIKALEKFEKQKYKKITTLNL